MSRKVLYQCSRLGPNLLIFLQVIYHSVYKQTSSISIRLIFTSSQVALAWIIARPSVTAPIASATSVGQVHELISAVKLELNNDEIEALNEVSDWRK
ncbi:MAG: aldo/keto reductase [Chloroflexi bacterium]|nr:aldo/keto reductase [Ktedonobacteraceae bacterium]MBV8822677.1 aldo/keto reductase [Ktedonobacteraceae bacterium]MBV9021496.1 aldo/keto reductase [Ktedonobacteraceae bacterium]MBV9708508.1 aldo/keto reductase [Chloroflexota bacterium]